jgi:hypothetical protein
MSAHIITRMEILPCRCGVGRKSIREQVQATIAVAVASSPARVVIRLTATGSNAVTTPEQANRNCNHILISGPLKELRFPVATPNGRVRSSSDCLLSGVEQT